MEYIHSLREAKQSVRIGGAASARPKCQTWTLIPCGCLIESEFGGESLLEASSTEGGRWISTSRTHLHWQVLFHSQGLVVLETEEQGLAESGMGSFVQLELLETFMRCRQPCQRISQPHGSPKLSLWLMDDGWSAK